MRGRLYLCSVAAATLVALTPAGSVAQTCEFHPADPKMFIKIDGDVYAYQSIEENTRILKQVKLVEPLKLKVEALERSVEIHVGNAEIRDDTVALLSDRADADRQMIASLTGAAVKTPFLKRPIVNFMAGVLLTGVLYGAWSWADSLTSPISLRREY